MTVIEPHERLRLQIPEEPVEMGVGLRDAVLAGARERGDFDDEICVAIWLWDQWRPSLEPAGIDRETFLDIVVAYGRELWLWLMGEHGWEPLVTGLAGRVARRLPPD